VNHIWTLSTDFHVVPNIKFRENSSRRSRADTRGQKDGRANKLIPFQPKRALVWRFHGLHVTCPVILLNFNQVWLPRHIFIKIPNIELHGNPSSGNRTDIFTQMDGQTDGHGKKTLFTTVRTRLTRERQGDM